MGGNGYLVAGLSGSMGVIAIDFHRFETLPYLLAEAAIRQGFIDDGGLIAVKTIIDMGPPTYQFDYVGSTPREINQYMHLLARQDGVDLNEVVKSLI